MKDLNATSMEAAVNMIKGSCRAMGVTVKEGQMEGVKPVITTKGIKENVKINKKTKENAGNAGRICSTGNCC